MKSRNRFGLMPPIFWHLIDMEVAMKDFPPGRRVLHKTTGYYGVVLLTWTVHVGHSLVQFDGEEKAIEVRQCELMLL